MTLQKNRWYMSESFEDRCIICFQEYNNSNSFGWISTGKFVPSWHIGSNPSNYIPADMQLVYNAALLEINKRFPPGSIVKCLWMPGKKLLLDKEITSINDIVIGVDDEGRSDISILDNEGRRFSIMKDGFWTISAGQGQVEKKEHFVKTFVNEKISQMKKDIEESNDRIWSDMQNMPRRSSSNMRIVTTCKVNKHVMCFEDGDVSFWVNPFDEEPSGVDFGDAKEFEVFMEYLNRFDSKELNISDIFSVTKEDIKLILKTYAIQDI